MKKWILAKTFEKWKISTLIVSLSVLLIYSFGVYHLGLRIRVLNVRHLHKKYGNSMHLHQEKFSYWNKKKMEISKISDKINFSVCKRCILYYLEIFNVCSSTLFSLIAGFVICNIFFLLVLKIILIKLSWVTSGLTWMHIFLLLLAIFVFSSH